MRGRLSSSFRYRNGMPAECAEAIRVLRNSGFAVAIIKPELVQHPLHRGRIELSMVAAGVNRAQELSHMNYGGKR